MGEEQKNMPWRFKTFAFNWLLLIAYCALIYIQSAYPSPENLPSFILMDKILHFVAYGIMGILFYRAYQTLRIKNNGQILFLLSVASATLYGISDEIHQYFIPYRNADVLDVVADMIGAVCWVYLYQWWARHHEPAG
jgi:VanZ family protein